MIQLFTLCLQSRSGEIDISVSALFIMDIAHKAQTKKIRNREAEFIKLQIFKNSKRIQKSPKLLVEWKENVCKPHIRKRG